MKFGGTSVASIEKINNVAEIIQKEIKKNKLIVILSAMAGVTNQMQNYIEEIKSKNDIENDLILTSGENVTIGILSSVLNSKKIKSIPLLGWQVPIITDNNHQKAKILNIDKDRIIGILGDSPFPTKKGIDVSRFLFFSEYHFLSYLPRPSL